MDTRQPTMAPREWALPAIGGIRVCHGMSCMSWYVIIVCLDIKESATSANATLLLRCVGKLRLNVFLNKLFPFWSWRLLGNFRDLIYSKSNKISLKIFSKMFSSEHQLQGCDEIVEWRDSNELIITYPLKFAIWMWAKPQPDGKLRIWNLTIE